jgi:phosphoribosyl 1,2-cyclic phosphodiesterase
MQVRLWGTRGSIPVSGPRYARFGGNTSCIEVRLGDVRIALDGGTGLRALGASGGPPPAAVLFSHYHWDHIQGVPFFRTAFLQGHDLLLAGPGDLEAVLRAQMTHPNFPIPLDFFQAELSFREVASDGALDVQGVLARSLVMPHPGGSVCYRLEAEGRSVVFATDVEHTPESYDALAAFAAGADLLIHDAQYTPEEAAGPHKGWGHSCWKVAAELARDAEVKQLALTHHDPERDDEGVLVLERLAREIFPDTFAAQDRQLITL